MTDDEKVLHALCMAATDTFKQAFGPNFHGLVICVTTGDESTSDAFYHRSDFKTPAVCCAAHAHIQEVHREEHYDTQNFAGGASRH